MGTDNNSSDNKTTMSEDEENAGTYIVTWSEGDAISVNGETSNDIDISVDGKKATFTLPVVSAPYHALYPAGAAKSYEAGVATVTIPAVQTYTAGAFDPTVAIMYGNAATANGPIRFSHAMAYMKVVVTGAENNKGVVDKHNIKSVTITSNGSEALNGDFTLTYGETIALSAPSTIGDDNKTITYNCGESGVAQDTPMFIAIPAQTYASGLTITITDVENHTQEQISSKSFTAVAGKVYRTPINYIPTATKIEGGIYTAEDWDAFISYFNANGNVGSYKITIDGEEGVHIMDDITTGTQLMNTNSTYYLKETIYGHGHTITHKAHKPLITFLGDNNNPGTVGAILDLTIVGSETRTKNAGGASWAPVLVVNNYGTIKNCTTNVNRLYNELDSGNRISSICRDNYGTIEDCESYGKIEIKSPKGEVWFGGIAETNTGTIKSCKNFSNITVTDPGSKCYLGGMVKTTFGGSMENCENKGNITITNLNGDCLVGGIATQAGTILTKCKNSGNIDITAAYTELRTFAMGGITAEAECTSGDTTQPSKFLYCENSGNLKVEKIGQSAMKGAALGGIAGGVNMGTTGTEAVTFTAFDGCKNSGNLTFYEKESIKGTHLGYSVGGILGRCVKMDASGHYGTIAAASGYYVVIRKNCQNTGTLDVCTYNGDLLKPGSSGARQTYVGGLAGFVCGTSSSSKAVIRGVSECTIKVGSGRGGICAGGLMGGSRYTQIESGGTFNGIPVTKATVTYETSPKLAEYRLNAPGLADNEFTSHGFLAGTIGWVSQTSSVGGNLEIAVTNNITDLGTPGAIGFAGDNDKYLTVGQCSYKYNNTSYPAAQNVYKAPMTDTAQTTE